MHWNAARLAEAIRWERKPIRIAFRMKPRTDDLGRSMHHQRMARKLDEWMSFCRYKQIHVAILERVFAHIWHERTVATQLAAVHCDQDLDVWEAVKDISVQKRTRATDPDPQQQWTPATILFLARQSLGCALAHASWWLQRRGRVEEHETRVCA